MTIFIGTPVPGDNESEPSGPSEMIIGSVAMLWSLLNRSDMIHTGLMIEKTEKRYVGMWAMTHTDGTPTYCVQFAPTLTSLLKRLANRYVGTVFCTYAAARECYDRLCNDDEETLPLPF